jgi:hypothetical protein
LKKDSFVIIFGSVVGQPPRQGQNSFFAQARNNRIKNYAQNAQNSKYSCDQFARLHFTLQKFCVRDLVEYSINQRVFNDKQMPSVVSEICQFAKKSEMRHEKQQSIRQFGQIVFVDDHLA